MRSVYSFLLSGICINIIKEIEHETNTLIHILLELQGPKIRVGELPQAINIHRGEILKFRHAIEMSDGIIPVDYIGISKDVKIGEKFLIDDGKVQFIVADVD